MSRYVTGLLKDAGIDTILLKGSGVAGLYPVPELRKSGDVDLLVENGKMAQEAGRCLQVHGFVAESGHQENHHLTYMSPEGIRWWLRNAIKNFTGFAPLGMVIIAMFGLGVAQHSGFIDACIRMGVGNRQEKRKIILWVIVLGLLSNAIGDGGYIILLPIAAMLFQWVGLHPIAGIVTAYVSVACGYSANIVLSTMDPLLAHTTQEAALAQTGYQGNTEPLCNYFFMSASTVAITAIVYWITQKWLLPTLGKYEGSMKVVAYHPLSRKERRAIMISIVVAAIYVALILWLTFSSYGILRGVNGGLMHSPFIAGILFLLSLGAGITGMAYGFSSGRYRTDNDVIEGLTQPMKLLGVYFVIAFFAAQMFACFEYSHLDKCLAIMGADLLSSFEPAPLSALVLFILFFFFYGIDKSDYGICYLQMGFYVFYLYPDVCTDGNCSGYSTMCFPYRR